MPHPSNTLRDRLAGGTTRDLGRTNEVVREAFHSALTDSSASIRARARKLLKQLASEKLGS